MVSHRALFLSSGVLLAFIIVSGQTSKVGKCPDDRTKKQPSSNDIRCDKDDDSECPKNMKCCKKGGKKVCRLPAEDREGRCPFVKLIKWAKEPSVKCDCDNDCQYGFKCCQLETAGYECHKPLKEGECPSVDKLGALGVCTAKSKRSRACGTDFGCYGNQKCCPCDGDRTVCTDPDPCSLPSDSGSCDDFTENWYFDHTMGFCKPFTYGGCGGNLNRFATQEACRKQCPDKVDGRCPAIKLQDVDNVSTCSYQCGPDKPCGQCQICCPQECGWGKCVTVKA